MTEISILAIVICVVLANLMTWKMFSITRFQSVLTERLAFVGSLLFCIISVWCLTFIR